MPFWAICLICWPTSHQSSVPIIGGQKMSGAKKLGSSDARKNVGVTIGHSLQSMSLMKIILALIAGMRNQNDSYSDT